MPQPNTMPSAVRNKLWVAPALAWVIAGSLSTCLGASSRVSLIDLTVLSFDLRPWPHWPFVSSPIAKTDPNFDTNNIWFSPADIWVILLPSKSSLPRLLILISFIDYGFNSCWGVELLLSSDIFSSLFSSIFISLNNCVKSNFSSWKFLQLIFVISDKSYLMTSLLLSIANSWFCMICKPWHSSKGIF